MSRRRPLILLLSLSLAACVSTSDLDEPSIEGGASLPATLAEHDPGSDPSALPALESGLHFFTTSADGAHSSLWRVDPEAEPGVSGALVRQRVGTVEHADGYAPRGTVVGDGSHFAWTNLPTDRRHGDPAELSLDGVVVDRDVLYLQRPRFLDDQLVYLRHLPGEDRFRSDGKLLPRLDDFELVAIDAASVRDGAPPIALSITSEAALWVQLCGVLPGHGADASPGLLVLVVDDDGSELRELRVDGSLRARWKLGEALVRDVQPDPDGERVAFALATGPDGASAVVRIPFSGGEPTELRSDLHRSSSPRIGPGGTIWTTEGDVASGTFAIPEDATTPDAVLWREHTPGSASWVLARARGDRVRLVPPQDAAQDVSILGWVR